MTSLIQIDTELAIQLREDGYPWHQIAERCGTTMHLLRRALGHAWRGQNKRYQSLTRGRTELLTDYQLTRIRRLREAGATWKELGCITGISHRKLQRYVEKHGTEGEVIKP